MLLAGVGALFDAGASFGPGEADVLVESFGALVRCLMLGQRDGEVEDGRSAGQGLILRRFIDERLADPDLGPHRLCDALGISRATLYRMFPEEGGVRGYITARRLDRCFDELRQGPAMRGRVRHVAERWGFFDAKSFNRAFRGRFGIAPSDCMDMPIASAADTESTHPVQDWLRRR
jgi:AraC-like DNA-binding protein